MDALANRTDWWKTWQARLRKHCKHRCGRGVVGARLRAVGTPNKGRQDTKHAVMGYQFMDTFISFDLLLKTLNKRTTFKLTPKPQVLADSNTPSLKRLPQTRKRGPYMMYEYTLLD